MENENEETLREPCHVRQTIDLYFKNHTVGMIVNPILQPRPREYAFSMNVPKVNNHIITPHDFITTFEFLGKTGARVIGNGGIRRCT